MKKNIIRIIGIFLGASLSFCGVMMIGMIQNPYEAILFTLFTVAFGGIAGFIFASIAGELLGTFISKLIFINSGNIKAPPPEYPLIRAKIANGKYDEAEKDLRNLLAEDNGNPHIVGMLAELFVDKTGQTHKAEGLLKAYLSKEERSDDDLKFVMMLTDIYLDSSRKDLALSLLKSEMGKKYNKISLKTISNRVSAIDKNCSSVVNN